jgi:hypothetical protein
LSSRACDFFDLFVPFAHPTRFSTPPQNRHPERSAAQIRRIKKGLGAESKDPGDACWQMLLEVFQPQLGGKSKS